MSIFKDYFFKTLRWPLIHRAGPLAALVEGLARSLDDMRQDIIWLRDQFNPWTCEPEMIVRHAESRGIRQHATETDVRFRNRCIHAFAWQRLGGGQMGMPQILNHYGYPNTRMLNVRAEDSERWAEFRVNMEVPETGLKCEDYTVVKDVSNDQKPARSLLAGLNINAQVSGSIKVAGITITSVVSRISPDWPTEATVDGAVEVGGYVHTVVKSIL
jgi:P2-related tail formation protein